MKKDTFKKMAIGGTLVTLLSAGAYGPTAFADTPKTVSSEYVFQDDLNFEAIDKVVTKQDWETLSDAQIDAKLTKAGLETIGDPESPFYNMTMKQIDALSDKEFNDLNGTENVVVDDEFAMSQEEKNEYITEIEDLYKNIKSKLSTEQVRNIESSIKDLAAKKNVNEFFNALDAIYDLADKEFNSYFEFEMSDEEMKDFENAQSVEVVITDQDWETLSDAQIDAKLTKAGFETIGDPESPVYNLTVAQIDALGEDELNKLFSQIK